MNKKLADTNVIIYYGSYITNTIGYRTNSVNRSDQKFLYFINCRL
jgi:hypothetical protein